MARMMLRVVLLLVAAAGFVLSPRGSAPRYAVGISWHGSGLVAHNGGSRAATVRSSTPIVVVEGNAPAWPVADEANSFGDKGSDFVQLWRKKAFYADHTGYLRLLDDRGCDVFLRPQRFGKTLWLSTMEYYYDVRFEDTDDKIKAGDPCFSTLFGGEGNEYGALAIARDEARNKELQNAFYVLSLEFPVDYSGDKYDAKFNNVINNQIRDFLDDHPDVLEASDYADVTSFVNVADCSDTLEHVVSSVNKKLRAPLMVLVDEADRAAMTALTESDDVAKGETQFEDAVKVMRGMMGALKSMAKQSGGNLQNRYFVTGIVGVSIPGSIFNGATSLVYDNVFANSLGFIEREAKAALEHVAGIMPGTPEFDRAVEVMRQCYDGYFFCGASEPVFNSQLVLHFCANYEAKFKGKIGSDAAVRNALPKLADFRQEISQGQVRLISSRPELADALALSRATGEPVTGALVERLEARDFGKSRFAVSYLYLIGALTHQGPGVTDVDSNIELVVPNTVTECAFMERYSDLELGAVGSPERFITEPSANHLKLLCEALYDNLRSKTGRDNEPSINALLYSSLVTEARRRNLENVRVSTQNNPKGKGKRAMDVQIVSENHLIIIELRFASRDKVKSTSAPQSLRGENLIELELRDVKAYMNFPGEEEYCTCNTGDEYVDSALKKAIFYKSLLPLETTTDDANNQRTVLCFGAVQIGDAFLVKME